MVYLLRNSQKIPPHLRRLVYASTLLVFPTLAFCLLQFGFISFLITPVALLLTIIYHIVLIVRHNRRASRQSRHNELVWESTGALAGGYMICTVWTAGLGMTVFRIAWTIHVTTQFDYYPYFSPFTILEAIFTLASTSVLWALVAVATHIRRKGRPKSGYRDLVTSQFDHS